MAVTRKKNRRAVEEMAMVINRCVARTHGLQFPIGVAEYRYRSIAPYTIQIKRGKFTIENSAYNYKGQGW